MQILLASSFSISLVLSFVQWTHFLHVVQIFVYENTHRLAQGLLLKINFISLEISLFNRL